MEGETRDKYCLRSYGVAKESISKAREAAEEKASRLNQLATESGRKIAGRNLIALSVGTAFCPEDGFDLEHLLAAADRRMYSVKQIHHEEIDNETRPPDSRSRGATVN